MPVSNTIDTAPQEKSSNLPEEKLSELLIPSENEDKRLNDQKQPENSDIGEQDTKDIPEMSTPPSRDKAKENATNILPAHRPTGECREYFEIRNSSLALTVRSQRFPKTLLSSQRHRSPKAWTMRRRSRGSET